MSRNNVRGPTSALTEFLRASGITPTTIARRVATQDRDQQQAAAGPSRAGSANASAGPSTSANARNGNGRSARARRRSSLRNSTTGYASDELDEPEGGAAQPDNDNAEGEGEPMDVDGEAEAAEAVEEEEEEAPKAAAKKRKLTKAAEAKLKAKEKKKRGIKDDDDDYDDEEEDAYTALSKSMWTNGAAKPPVGSFENCAVCGKQFTVTKYTMASSNGQGFMCHQCAKQSGNDPFKKPAAPKKRKAPAEREKRNVTNFEERRFPTLVSLCIQLITKHIDDIDALGDIGAMNVEAIGKALSKNRSLTPENAHLFYSPANLTLTFYDATNLASPALETLAYHNANLTSLRLDYCGHLDDNSFKVFCTSLPSLQRIELLGPFLVRAPLWQQFFKSHPKLTGFLITQSPRFDLDCVKSLVKHCPGVVELRLSQIGLMSDGFLGEIARLKRGLRYLDVSEPGKSCSEAVMIRLLKAVGAGLEHLNVSKHDELSDEFLKKGLAAHTKALQSLVLSHLPELTDEGLASFFNGWKNTPLYTLDASRNEVMGGAALESILNHSGAKLEQLNINGWKDVSEEALKKVGAVAAQLKKIDVGFCRAVDDFVVQEWLEGKMKRGQRVGGCSMLEEVKVFGCNRVTASCPKKKGVSILGVESHSAR